MPRVRIMRSGPKTDSRRQTPLSVCGVNDEPPRILLHFVSFPANSVVLGIQMPGRNARGWCLFLDGVRLGYSRNWGSSSSRHR